MKISYLIPTLRAKIEVLERRAQYVEKRIADRRRQGATEQVSFDLAEVSALRTATRVCAWFVQDGTSGDGSSPMGILNRFLETDAEDTLAVSRLQQEALEALKCLRD